MDQAQVIYVCIYLTPTFAHIFRGIDCTNGRVVIYSSLGPLWDGAVMDCHPFLMVKA